MKIYTSYFAKAEQIRKDEKFPISIARFNPKFFQGSSYQMLAPYSNMLRMEWEDYLPLFDKILAKTTPNQCLSDLERMSQGKDIVMLCYEKDHNDCHRKIVADWMNEAGYDVEELYKIEEVIKKEPPPRQLDLFQG